MWWKILQNTILHRQKEERETAWQFSPYCKRVLTRASVPWGHRSRSSSFVVLSHHLPKYYIQSQPYIYYLLCEKSALNGKESGKPSLSPCTPFRLLLPASGRNPTFCQVPSPRVFCRRWTQALNPYGPLPRSEGATLSLWMCSMFCLPLQPNSAKMAPAMQHSRHQDLLNEDGGRDRSAKWRGESSFGGIQFAPLILLHWNLVQSHKNGSFVHYVNLYKKEFASAQL